jgi:hypothetical protein
MKLIFENWRRFYEPALLTESRISDVKDKYPNLNSKGLIDILIEDDPSGNQKYLAWGAKQLSKREDASKGVALYISGLIKRYHSLMKFVAKEDKAYKDINYFKKYEDLERVVRRAELKKREKEIEDKRKREEKEKANESTDILYKDEDFFVVRPLSTEASCYWGRGTKWCISATQSENYFDRYTGDGQAFYFVFMRNRKNFPSNLQEVYKSVAMVFDSQYDEYFTEAYDAQDNLMDKDDVIRIFTANLFGYGFMEAIDDAMADGYDYLSEMEEGDDKQTILNAYKKAEEDPDSIPLADFYNDVVLQLVGDRFETIESLAMENLDDKPPTIPEAAFEEVEEEYDFKYFDVNREDNGAGGQYWEASTSFDFGDIELLDEDGDQIWFSGLEEEYGGEIRDILDDNYFDPEEVGFYEDDLVLRFSPSDYDEETRGIEGFRNFLERIKGLDGSYEDVRQDIINLLINKKVINISNENIGKLINSLESKELQNFEIDVDGREIKMESVPQVITIWTRDDTLNFVKRFYKNNLDDQKRKEFESLPNDQQEREMQTQAWNMQFAIANQLKNQIKDENLISPYISSFFNKAYKQAASQLSLPGIEPGKPVDKFRRFKDKEGKVVSLENIILVYTGGGAKIKIQASGEITEQKAKFISEFVEFFDENFDSLKKALSPIYSKILKQVLNKYGYSMAINESKKTKSKKLLVRVRGIR